MISKEIAIITEAGGDLGYGHVVRMSHLYKVLQAKGHSVAVGTNTEGKKFMDSIGIGSMAKEERIIIPCDTAIIDIMNNDDEYLLQYRLKCKKLVVIVGAGHTITPQTRWIADLVVYHTIYNPALSLWTPGETVLQGLEYIMMDPAFASPNRMINPVYDFVLYFGGGLHHRVVETIRTRLYNENYRIWEMGSGEFKWVYRPADLLNDAVIYLGSMGMMAYEAIAARAYPIVLCRSEEHVEDAKRLEDKGLLTSLGMITRPTKENSIDNLMDIIESKLVELARGWNPPAHKTKLLDGKGIYRVALEILNGA